VLAYSMLDLLDQFSASQQPPFRRSIVVVLAFLANSRVNESLIDLECSPL
jgi:hypothetical protein